MKPDVLVATRDVQAGDTIQREVADLCLVQVSASPEQLYADLRHNAFRVFVLDSKFPRVDELELGHALFHGSSRKSTFISWGALDVQLIPLALGTTDPDKAPASLGIRRSLPCLVRALRALLDPAAQRTLDAVRYRARARAFFVVFRSGKTYELPRKLIEADDASPLVGEPEIIHDGDAFEVRQKSGNTYQVAWDFVLYHEEPSYPYYKQNTDQQESETRSAGRIAARIRAERQGRKWSLGELARRTGMKVPNLSRLESGKHRPSLETLERIAGALGIRVADLVAASDDVAHRVHSVQGLAPRRPLSSAMVNADMKENRSMEVSGLALSVFLRVAPPAIRWLKGGPLEQSVRVTAAQFPQFEDLKTSLVSWCDDARVGAEFQRAHEGQTRDVDLHRLTEALLDHDFSGAADPQTAARKVVETFFSVLEAKLLEDPTAVGRFLYGASREHDVKTEEQHAQISEQNAQILELLQQMKRETPASAPTVTSAEGESDTPLNAQINLARERLLRGYPRQALELLDTIERDRERKTLAPRVVFRLVTNRAACNLELGRVDQALAGFEAAYQLQPGDAKAIANLALVHLIRGQIAEAKAVARRALESDPKRADALTILAQAMERAGEAEQAIQLLAPYSKDPGCRTAVALLHTNAERWEEVRAILEPVPAPDRSFQEVLFLGEAYVKVAERQIKSVSPLLSDMPAEMLTRLKSLDTLLGPVVDAGRQEGSSILLPALTLRASARLMTERQMDGIADLEEASRVEKAPQAVFRNLALAYMIQEQPAKAVSTFRDALARFPSNEEELRPLLVEALLGAQQLPEAVKEGRRAWDQAQSPQGRRDAGLSYAVALAGSEDGLEAERIVHALREASPGDAEIELRWAEALVRLGRNADAIPILEAHSRSTDGRVKALAHVYLGDAYARCERFDDAATAYRPIAHPIDSPATFHKYLLALYRSGRWAEALESMEKARQLRAEAMPPLSEAEIQGQIFEELGDLARARTLYERVVGADKSAWYFHLRLARVLFRQDELALAKRAVDVAAESPNRSPRDLLRIAQVYAALGQHARALQYGYKAVRGDAGDPDIALGFIGIVLATPEEARIELDQAAAQPTSFVQVESDGQTHEFVVLERGEQPVHASELKPDDPLAIKLIGARVGERIVLDDRPLSRREAVIQSVRHRYVAAFQAILNQFAIRYPGRPGLVAVPVRENFHEQVKSLVRSRHETVRTLFDIYTRHPVTIGAVADICGETAFETLLALAHEPSTPIASRVSLQGLEETALAALTEAEAVLLDPTAVAALALLELVDVPGRLGARIVVPQEFLDQLQNEILHRRLSEGREHIVLGVEGDQIVRRVISAEEAARATQVLSGIREKCKAFEVAPRPVTPGKWSDWADRDLLGADSADAVAIARSTGAVLVSADARLLAAVANDYGVTICTVYDLINYFQRKGLLSEEAFENVVSAMVWHGFEHTPIRASTLLRTLRSAGYEHSGKFERLLDVLSNPTTDIESAVRVVANFLGALNQLPVIPPNIESIVRRVLERLVRGQDVTRVRALRRFAGTAPLPSWLKTLVKKCADQVEKDMTKGHFVQP